jgi:glutathione S-transferase
VGFRALGPLPAFLMRRGMRINRSSAERSLARVREVFETVANVLEDGRTYLVGDGFTAADLSFAALAAPVLLPSGYGSSLPEPQQLPEEFRVIVDSMRATAAGGFALRLYEDHR